MELLLFAVIFILLAVLQSVLMRHFGLRRFSYRRAFSRESVYAGESLEFVEVIRNQGFLFLPWVRLETRIPTSFEFRTREEVDVRGNNYLKSVFTLMPFSQVTRRHRVKTGQRGHFVLAGASLTAGDLLGMRLEQKEIEARAELFVYPALLRDVDGLFPASRAQGDVSVPRWIQPDPFLINGIRGYQAGDPQRDIHWAATARTGELQVKTHDFTVDSRLMVLINVQKTEEQWGDLMDYETARIEYAISLAASLCMQALSRGQDAGFAANMPLDEEEECACLLPERGAGREDVLLRAFSRLRIRRVLTFPTFLEALPRMPDTDIVILSCYDSEAIQTRMQWMRSPGGSVTLHILPEAPYA